jgi:hypothetical protein
MLCAVACGERYVQKCDRCLRFCPENITQVGTWSCDWGRDLVATGRDQSGQGPTRVATKVGTSVVTQVSMASGQAPTLHNLLVLTLPTSSSKSVRLHDTKLQYQ